MPESEDYGRVWRKGAGKRGLRQCLEEKCRKARTTAGFGGKVPESEVYGRVWRKVPESEASSAHARGCVG